MAYRGIDRENHRQRQSSRHAHLRSADRLSARDLSECSACHRATPEADEVQCGSCCEWGCRHCLSHGECNSCRRVNEDTLMMALLAEDDCGPDSDLDKDHDAIDRGLGLRLRDGSLFDLEDSDTPPSSGHPHSPDPEGSCYFDDEEPRATWGI